MKMKNAMPIYFEEPFCPRIWVWFLSKANIIPDIFTQKDNMD